MGTFRVTSSIASIIHCNIHTTCKCIIIVIIVIIIVFHFFQYRPTLIACMIYTSMSKDLRKVAPLGVSSPVVVIGDASTWYCTTKPFETIGSFHARAIFVLVCAVTDTEPTSVGPKIQSNLYITSLASKSHMV